MRRDPLSPALFVIFIEPKLCYLRATTRSHGIQIPGIEEPHHLLEFADDCNGVLQNLADASEFVARIKHYVTRAGLQSNVHKPHILPFQPLNTDIRRLLEQTGWDVVADNSDIRVLGTYKSPSLPSSTRFSRLIDAIISRCLLWRFRARTLLDRATILRVICLPLLRYTAAVKPVASTVLEQLKITYKSFLSRNPLLSMSNFGDQYVKNGYIFQPPKVD
ncbi:hypothetical protein PsorP6_006464 [Peronosclerospora sorghi]|uniref:Uncharacterized protein n=1 Tax=Peronosclerospora sorghi TaxID=230839 RepID=A0ACC0W7E0_9STRA|nr:hypothetical protein PsorP6_006464 [Peronosclerospora sorghi]